VSVTQSARGADNLNLSEMLDEHADSDQSDSCRLTEAVETSVQCELLPATAGAFRIHCFENNISCFFIRY